MKIKHPLSTLLAFIIVGCSEPDPMKERYIQDCSADGAATETCSCLFDYGKKNMSEIEFMSSDFTHAYRRDNNIPKPGFEFNNIGELVQKEIEYIYVDPDCVDEGRVCEVEPHP